MIRFAGAVNRCEWAAAFCSAVTDAIHEISLSQMFKQNAVTVLPISSY
jgi:hypothetical protein